MLIYTVLNLTKITAYWNLAHRNRNVEQEYISLCRTNPIVSSNR